MEISLLVLGIVIGGAIMFYIQPWVKDTVTKVFLGAPALYAQALALKQRAEDLIDKAKSKQDAAVDSSKGSPGA